MPGEGEAWSIIRLFGDFAQIGQSFRAFLSIIGGIARFLAVWGCSGFVGYRCVNRAIRDAPLFAFPQDNVRGNVKEPGRVSAADPISVAYPAACRKISRATSEASSGRIHKCPGIAARASMCDDRSSNPLFLDLRPARMLTSPSDAGSKLPEPRPFRPSFRGTWLGQPARPCHASIVRL
jgi:hypothetical protein